ncbi:disease resistance protein Pik-2-like [Miscanthus floridulus]|uniref:disease resistance protein Pik-2-like n=1 Tax=Miscanthus floridulus TaxID=154761 RepID=UPI003457409E
MEATALSVGKSVLNGALGYAKSAFAEEVALQLGIQKDQTFIADELEMMRSFMMEAHEEQDNNKVVKTWVKQVRDTAYDVEDSLQDFAVRLKRPSWWRFPHTLLDRRCVAKQMKELRAKVEDVSQRNARYHLIKGSGFKAATTAAEQSSAIGAAIFGVDDARYASKEMEQRVDLVQLISTDDEEPKVIAVWGTSGDIGIASTIMEAYENISVQGKFSGRAWVRVMHPLSPKGFVQSLVTEFEAAKGVEVLKEIEEAEKVATKFNEYVSKKRCLIVLNDLSTIEEWNQIKKCFQDIKRGSRIIVSTMHVEVASLCAGQESQASQLKRLSHDQTLYAFYRKGSQEGNDSLNTVSSREAATVRTEEDPTQDALEESQLIGRKKEIDYVVNLLIPRDSQQVEVISVCGMGGLGKTALVSSVYQSPKLSDRFEKFVFVTIMRPFELAEFLKSLTIRLDQGSSTKKKLLDNRGGTKKSLATMSVQGLMEELKSLINMKKCLIVLDDVSSTSEWELISPCLVPHLEQTSRIIVTTRENDIAKHCSGKQDNVYNLEVLDPEGALCLFRKKVFAVTKYSFEKYHDLVEEEEKILKKCGGLPLAIAAIGGFLASRPITLEEWRKLNENIRAELEMNPELEKIRGVLEKSYDGLPYHLKSCFLYLSIFPEDQTISRRRLVGRWTAEGYSSETRGKSAIEMADGYFTDLKNRSMILPCQQSVHSRKSIDSCKVHDLIRDIAISKSMEENLVFILEEGCNMNVHGPIRHLAISSNWKGDKSEFEGIVDMSRIRSLSLFGEWKPFFISDKMRFLRVLDLEGTDHSLKYHHLDKIWKLIHLKYLSLRGCIGVDLLPVSLGNLKELQTLDVRETFVKALPKTIIKLRKLQYIHAGSKSDYVSEENDSLMRRCLRGARLCARCCLPILLNIDGPSCKALTRRDACTFACCVAFPAAVTGADEERGAMLPRGIGKLKDLHTLREVNVGRGNNVLRDIGMLTGLRKLGVSGINKNHRAFYSAISKLSRLESLSVCSAGKPGLQGCLDEISAALENLQSLKVYGNLEKLPQWINELQHLVKLKLAGTRLLEHDAAMEFLGNVMKLEILGLFGESFLGEELDFRSPQAGIAFGSLRVLTLSLSENIKSVKFDERALPKLERLQITGILNNEIDFSGLGCLRSINEVQFSAHFPMDWKRIQAARHDGEPLDKIYEDERQEQTRKEGELKMKIQEQLAQNTKGPIILTD